jgi:hypothetical protein
MANSYVSTVRATSNIRCCEEIMMTMKHNLRNLVLVSVVALFSAAAFMANGAFGNPQQQNRQLTVASPTVRAKLSEGAANVRTVQSVLNRVEKAKYLKEQDVKQLETAMSATAEALYAAFNKATSEAEEAGKSEGKTGSVGSLKAFEDGVTVQLASVNQIEARLKAIQKSVENKSYKMDRSLEQSLNQTEREQIREARPRVTYAGRLVNSFAEVSSGGSNLTSAAIPKLAAPCVSPCWNKQWSVCLTCILSKGPAVIDAYKDFLKCWNGAKNPFKVVKQAACLAKFIAILA